MIYVALLVLRLITTSPDICLDTGCSGVFTSPHGVCSSEGECWDALEAVCQANIGALGGCHAAGVVFRATIDGDGSCSGHCSCVWPGAGTLADFSLWDTSCWDGHY